MGIDGMDAEITRELPNKLIPNIRKLENQENTASGKLESYVIDGYKLPHTGPCWTTLYTGVDEEQHGMTEGGWREGDSHFNKIYTIFDEMAKEYSLSLYGMPMTYPAKDVNGWMVSGFVTTTIQSLFHKAYHPDDLDLPENFIKVTASYMAKRMLGGVNRKTDTRYGKRILSQGEEKRFEYFKDLWKNNNTDIVAYGTTLVDKFGHINGCSTGNSMTRDSYSQVDDMLGELIEMTNPDNVMICSDHGFQGNQHSLTGYGLNTAGKKMDSIFDFAETVLENVGLEYTEDKFGIQDQNHNLTDEEQDDIKDQLRSLGYLK